jgi:hypothetical protein
MLGECIAGGGLDLARQAPFYPAMIHLGYPSYFTYILGSAKLLAVAALLAPGLPRLKEWAYAGIMINMVGAAASSIGAGDGFADIVPPLIFAVIALISWQLRPPVRAPLPQAGPSPDRARAPLP